MPHPPPCAGPWLPLAPRSHWPFAPTAPASGQSLLPLHPSGWSLRLQAPLQSSVLSPAISCCPGLQSASTSTCSQDAPWKTRQARDTCVSRSCPPVSPAQTTHHGIHADIASQASPLPPRPLADPSLLASTESSCRCSGPPLLIRTPASVPQMQPPRQVEGPTGSESLPSSPFPWPPVAIPGLHLWLLTAPPRLAICTGFAPFSRHPCPPLSSPRFTRKPRSCPPCNGWAPSPEHQGLHPRPGPGLSVGALPPSLGGEQGAL